MMSIDEPLFRRTGKGYYSRESVQLRTKIVKNTRIFIGILLLCALPVMLVHAQELIIYPAKGQSAQQQIQQQQQADTKASLDKYKRAYSACLEGKGYTVK